MKEIIILSSIFVSTLSFAKNIVDYKREGRGENGYDRVNQSFSGSTNGGHDNVYLVTCENPGSERCRFIPPTSNPPGGGNNINLDDVADYYGSPFMNDFADLAELKIEDDLELSGFFDKAIQFTLNEIEYQVYITLRWELLSDGSYQMTGSTEAFEL